MKERNPVLIRTAILVAVVGLIAWFLIWGTGHAWQYEIVQDGVLYRGSARTDDEFVAAELKVEPVGMIVVGTAEQLHDGALVTAQNYGNHNKTRVMTLTINPQEAPTDDQVKRFIDYVGLERRRPVLLVDTDGRTAGMLVAAYRLGVLQMPLGEVEKLAALKDAPAKTVEQVRLYAQKYAQQLKRVSAPALPLGPTLPQ